MPETTSQPAPVLDSDGPSSDGDQLGDFEDAFRLAKHALAHASISVFARYGVYEGQQFVLRRLDRKSTRLNSSHLRRSRMPSSA